MYARANVCMFVLRNFYAVLGILCHKHIFLRTCIYDMLQKYNYLFILQQSSTAVNICTFEYLT